MSSKYRRALYFDDIGQNILKVTEDQGGNLQIGDGDGKNWRWWRLKKEGSLKYLEHFEGNEKTKRGNLNFGDGDG